MNRVQVFKWFCKEQKIMPMIREIYYQVRPSNNVFGNGGITVEYKPFDEYLDYLIRGYGFLEALVRLENAYYFAKGWKEYSDFSRRYNLEAVNKKWSYFVRNNVYVDENTLSVGNTIEYHRPYSREYENGVIKTIDIVANNLVVTHLATDRTSTVYLGYLKDADKVKYYIKRRRRKYYGVNRE